MHEHIQSRLPDWHHRDVCSNAILPEIELPDSQLSSAPWKIAILVCEGETKLNELEHVDIAPA